jgi:hypothetical protein
MQKLRFHPQAWTLAPAPDDEVSRWCAKALKCERYLDVVSAAALLEIERLTVLQTGGFND